MNILACVTLNEYTALYKVLAREMDFAKFRFFGFHWSMGRTLRSDGHDYIHVPFRIDYSPKECHELPVSELVHRGLFEKKAPARVNKLVISLENITEREIEAFEPDVLILDNTASIICYIMREIAQKRNIPVLSLHTSFIKNYSLINTSGSDWEHYLSKLDIGKKHHAESSEVELRRGNNWNNSRSLAEFAFLNMERLLRLIFHAPSYDSWKLIASSFVLKFCKSTWFPEIKTLRNNLDSGYILVAVHQPILKDRELNWINLIRFAVKCTPENIPIVMRPHPAEYARRLPDDLTNQLKNRDVYVSRVNIGPNFDQLLDQCHAVLTITSGLGMEALLRGKYVFTLGRAFYTRPGLAQQVESSDTESVREMLMQDRLPHPNMSEVHRFVNCLISDYMVSRFDPDGVKKLASRLLALTGANTSHS